MTTRACPNADDAAAWVLGALPDPEAGRFEAHLAGCAACQEEVAELRTVADALPGAAPPMEPPPELKARIMAVVEAEAAVLHATGPEADRPPARKAPAREPWWRRPILGLRPGLAMAAAACVLMLAGVGLGVALDGGARPAGDGARTIAGQAPRGARAALEVRGDRARLVLAGMPAPPEGRIYQVWVRPRGGDPRPTDAPLFDVRNGRAEVEVPGSLDGAEALLVTHEEPGGSRVPTRAPALSFALA